MHQGPQSHVLPATFRRFVLIQLVVECVCILFSMLSGIPSIVLCSMLVCKCSDDNSLPNVVRAYVIIMYIAIAVGIVQVLFLAMTIASFGMFTVLVMIGLCLMRGYGAALASRIHRSMLAQRGQQQPPRGVVVNGAQGGSVMVAGAPAVAAPAPAMVQSYPVAMHDNKHIPMATPVTVTATPMPVPTGGAGVPATPGNRLCHGCETITMGPYCHFCGAAQNTASAASAPPATTSTTYDGKDGKPQQQQQQQQQIYL